MKDRTVFAFRRWIMLIVPCILSIVPLIESSSTSEPLDHREAYFNGSSYIRMHSPLTLQTQIGLSFRTCTGGELFSQKQGVLHVNTIKLSVNREGLIFTATTNGKHYETKIVADLLDNKWHTVSLRYILENFTLSVGRHTEVIANKTFMPELLTNPVFYNEGAILIVGTHFNGCILEGPTIVFNSQITPYGNIQFGPCPMSLNNCVVTQDMMTPSGAVDHCMNKPCMMHGTCISRPDKYECHCTARYHGKNCESDLGPPCNKQPCKNGATCIEDATGQYSCTCLPLFTGMHCEVRISSASICDTNPCLNGGACKVLNEKKQCTCRPGFKGQLCEINVNECESNPCLNGGVCIDKVNGFSCDCSRSGYKGEFCEEDVNECLSSPCKNGARCFDNYGGYTCQCLHGFDGQNCDVILKECLTQPCSNRGTCIDKLGGYDCNCLSGFTGKNCDMKLSSCESSSCPPYADCVEHGHGYKCICKPGINAGKYPNCTTETSTCPTNPCKNGGSCSYHMGTYNCSCLPGFSGKLCEVNIDECATKPCLHGGFCVDKANGYHCNCTDNYMGTNCEKPYNVCEFKPCQNNGTCSMPVNKHEFVCDCLRGFEGKHCEKNIDDCAQVVCPPGKICVDLVEDHSCECPAGFTGENCSIETDPCQKTPCKNGASCHINPASYKYTCKCPPEWEGPHCDIDVNECERNHSLCGKNGICVNRNGGFQCYCEPGYTGEYCNMDFDECLSVPCKNNATCKNEVNNFSCTCTPGYTGKDCSVDIDECQSNPCMAGSTCIDGIANFTCVCPLGFTGVLCEINIDDCASTPCQNNGQCLDGINSYSCNCSDTGYSGSHCEINIDDCLSNPCQNGAQCMDGIKDYVCNCFPGYRGKNCEEDIDECSTIPCKNNATCLQKSNQSLYYSTAFEANVSLPIAFMKQFSYADAAGFVCVCIAGTSGDDCGKDINECESNPCKKGQCLDQLGKYECICDPGYQGSECEDEINECEVYHPCVYGTCEDQIANYFCKCNAPYGGKNCSVELTGCNAEPCLNNGSCIPYLENETTHKYNCTCPNGYHGHSCELVTTMSMTGNSFVRVNTQREEGYDISFRFRTTLGHGLLAMGSGSTFYILELTGGRLNLHSSLLNRWEGVFIGSKLNNSNWQKVFVAINSTHLVLAANEEQTIYPINNNEGSPNLTSFAHTYLGGTERKLKNLVHGPDFIGCTQDVVINGKWVLPKEDESVSLVNVETKCERKDQCLPVNPCHSGGLCTDKWRNFTCTCQRPYLGHTCQYNYTAATFGYENITNSLVTVTVDDLAKRAVRTVVDISMFIRTRQSAGQIFYLGSAKPNSNETYITAQLGKGELLVSIQFNNTPESYTVGGVQLDNGYNHLIEVIRNKTLVQVKINGTEYFRKTISSTGQLDATNLYLGGSPQARIIRQATADSTVLPTDTTPASGPLSVTTPLSRYHFKGIIQDVQISNGSHNMVVEFYPLQRVSELETLIPFGNVSFDTETVLKGVLSDDLCRINPCSNNGTCINTWNDYKCNCTRGFKGKNCEELEFCQVHRCPDGSHCNNLDNGYECIANATLDGEMPPALYHFVAPVASKDQVEFRTLKISYRTKTGGTVLFVKPQPHRTLQNPTNYFIVFVNGDQVIVQWKIDSFADKQIIKKENPNGDWVTLYFRIKDGMLSGGTKDYSAEDESPSFSSPMDVLNFTNLFAKTGTIHVGGSDKMTFDVQKAIENYTIGSYYNSSFSGDDADGMGNTVEMPERAMTTDTPMRRVDSEDYSEKKRITDRFKGCIGEIRVGDYLLPFFQTNDIYNDSQNISPKHFDLQVKLNFEIGCTLCYSDVCKHDGVCEDPKSTYACKCLAGYTRDDCSENIDECVNNTCANNSTCVDGIANYTCSCAPGYQGWLCDKEIDECQSNPCRNKGVCVDELNNYRCDCPDDYVGKQCESKKLITCDNVPCHEGSTCVDGYNKDTGYNYTCHCAKGMSGLACDTAFCLLQHCEYGDCNVTVAEPFCECQAGFDGKFCDNNIDDCEDNPCKNKGNCTDGVAKFVCDCTGTGFTGETCEIDIDECFDSRDICGRGECVNERGSFHCRCEEGMCGHGCILEDPCFLDPNLCGEHGTCEPFCSNLPEFKCLCQDNFVGTYCNETEVSISEPSSSLSAIVIIIPIVLLILIGGGIGLAIFIAMARSKRATRGTYSPSAQEFCNPRVELDHVLKPPPEERLI